MARPMLICWRYRLTIVCGLLLFRCEPLKAYANQHPPLSTPAAHLLHGEDGPAGPLITTGNGAETSGFEASDVFRCCSEVQGSCKAACENLTIVLDTMSLGAPSSIVGWFVRWLLPLLLALPTPWLTVRGEFVAVRASTTNRTLLCWAIKLSPTAYVTEAQCVRPYRKHQIVMIYGDIAPGPSVRERLGRKVASLRQPLCRHRVPPMMLASAPDGSNRTVLDRTVRNFIASYSVLSATGRTLTCRECQVSAIRRVLPCPATPGTAVLYTDCLQQMDATVAAARSKRHRDAWVWQFRRKLKATLYAELERMGRERMAMLNFMTGTVAEPVA